MANAEKTAAVEELAGKFRESSGAVLTEYRGLTVAQLSELRRFAQGQRHVRRGEEHAHQDRGRPRRAWVTRSGRCCLGRPRSRSSTGMSRRPPRACCDFAKANPLLVIKGGVLDGKSLTAADVSKLADLEPREVLLAKLAGAMKASMANAAATFNALPTQMALLADALRAKLEAGAPAAAPSDDATDTESQTQD